MENKLLLTAGSGSAYKGENMKKKLAILMITLCISMATTVCGATYTGKVVDADTKKPIEGAIVVASWLEETTEIGATHTRTKDIKEVLTDKNGRWVIKGPRGREGGIITAIFTLLTGSYYTRPPEFIIFKPGYCSWPKGFGISVCKIKMKGLDIQKTVELPKLSDRRRGILLLNIPFIAAEQRGKVPLYENLLKIDIEEWR